MELQKLNPTRNDFIEALQRGKECLEEAGRILVDLIDKDPSEKERIMEEHPEITEDVLETFERIGRKQLYYKLCLLQAPGMRALQRCPYSEQVKYASEPIPMVLLNARDDTESLMVPIHAMNTEQVRQVFGAHRVRTLGEQRAFLERQQTRPVRIDQNKPYTIGRNCITFHEPVRLSSAEMARFFSPIWLGDIPQNP